jgi:murein DD-endopeptidase MepM/ murein hydrolase activator NlpD
MTRTLLALVAGLVLVGCVSSTQPPSAEPRAVGLDEARSGVDRALEEARAVPQPEPEPVWPEVEPKDPPPVVSYARPYPVIRVISGHWECRGRRYHGGYDLVGDGPDGGLGTPIFSIGTARITLIGRPSENARSFGRPLQRRGTTRRNRMQYPTSAEVDGYGRVYFFTRSYGSWRSGAVVEAELLEGPLTGHTVRYLHLGAIRPELRVGHLVKPGTEIGLMGGTGIQDSTPHLHIDLADPLGNRVDLAPVLGIAAVSKDEIPVCRRARRG